MTKLWGGRFSKPTNKLVEEFTKSIQFDYKLAEYDCLGSLAHIEVLKKARLLSLPEYHKLKAGLNAILKTIKAGTFRPSMAFEDIHSQIQHELDQKAGKAAAKLHTCRSRNDQVVLSTKMYCLDNLIAVQSSIKSLTANLASVAQRNKDVVIPGYTHLQHAIPVAASQYFTSYADMLSRDLARILNAQQNIKLTFGAGAVAGTFIDAAKYSVNKISAPTNSIDAVSARDFVVEILSALSVLQMHLSRLAEDLILWSTKEFDFIEIDDAFCTGSSLMPQKKNPDVLELIRGYTGRIYGNLISVLVMMKGLPLSYNRDMQHDKEPLFDSFEIAQKELGVLTELLKNIKFRKENIKKQLEDESLYATDLADYLVQNKVAFKDAHAILGKLIQYKYKSGDDIVWMDDATLKKFHPLLTSAVVKKIINPEHSVKSKKSIRGK